MSFTYPPESKPLDGYTIKRAISVGGFGEVYYALSDAGKEVALKLLRHNFDVELRGVSQCLNLNHPNLLQIFDIRTDRQGQHWIVMEYLSGRTLDERLEDNPGGLDVEEVQQWLGGISAGLTYLHGQGLVHRDLKPANIFREGDTIKVGDVGLSKFITESQRHAQTQSVGTVYYMAPEVAHGKYGREVDVYAVGVILYEMLTGDVPFKGESQAEILMKHLTEKPNLENLPARLRPVLARALEKDPHLRTPSVARLEHEFRLAMEGRSSADALDIPAENILPEYAIPRGRRPVQSLAGAAVTQHPPTLSPQAQYEQTRYPQTRYPQTQSPQTQYPVTYSPAAHAAVGPPRRQQHAARHNQYANAGRNHHADFGEQPAGLGIWKWFLLGLILFWMIGGSGFNSRLMTMFLVIGGSVFLMRTLIGWLAGGPQYHSSRSHGPRYPGPGGASPQTFAATMPPPLPPAARAQRRHLSREQRRAARRELHQQRRDFVMQRRMDRAQYVAARRAEHRRHRRQYSVVAIDPRLPRQIRWQDRLTDGATGMTLAAIVGTVITAAVGMISGMLPDFNSAVLFGSSTILAAWAAIGVAKTGEGRSQSFLQRRLTWAAAGGTLGYAVWWLSSVLLVSFPGLGETRQPAWLVSLFDLDGMQGSGPLHPLAFILFFGLLFGARRWWWQADALRSRRIRISSLLFTAGIGTLAALASGFPLYWGLSLSAAISGVVQLASVWMPQDARQHMLEGPQHVV